jgi:hypothetical protein
MQNIQLDPLKISNNKDFSFSVNESMDFEKNCSSKLDPVSDLDLILNRPEFVNNKPSDQDRLLFFGRSNRETNLQIKNKLGSDLFLEQSHFLSGRSKRGSDIIVANPQLKTKSLPFSFTNDSLREACFRQSRNHEEMQTGNAPETHRFNDSEFGTSNERQINGQYMKRKQAPSCISSINDTQIPPPYKKRRFNESGSIDVQPKTRSSNFNGNSVFNFLNNENTSIISGPVFDLESAHDRQMLTSTPYPIECRDRSQCIYYLI